MKTKNITVKIDESVYQQARRHAAAHGTSVSQMVRQTLERCTKADDVSQTEEARRRITLDALWKSIDDLPRPVIAGKKFTRADSYDHRRFHRH